MVGKIIFHPQPGKVTARNEGQKTLSISRKRRRDSQRRHRLHIASCYEKLKSSLPGGCEGVKYRADGIKVKSLNKVKVLERSRDYIRHLEDTLVKLLEEKAKIEITRSDRSENPVSHTIRTFRNLEEFQKHFASKFHTKGNVLSYFSNDRAKCANLVMRNSFCHPIVVKSSVLSSQVTPENVKSNDEVDETCKQDAAGMSSQTSSEYKVLSQNSDDLGFFSGENGSQEKNSGEQPCTQPHKNQESQESVEFHAFRCPYYGPNTYQPYVHKQVGLFNNSQFYFYVPPVGYPAPFYAHYGDNATQYYGHEYPHPTNMYDVTAGQSYQTTLPGNMMGSAAQMPSYVINDVAQPRHVQRQEPFKASAMINNIMRSEGHTEARRHRLTMEYEYNESDGHLSPPKISLRGLSDKAKKRRKPKTLIVIEKSDQEAETINIDL